MSTAAHDVVHNLNCKENYVDAGGMHMNEYNKITALYSRLSVGDEDRDGGESNSIVNQKKMLEKYAKEQGFTNLDHYTDVYNQRLIPFDTKMAVQTPKITAFEGKRDCRKPLFLFWGFM